MMQDLSAALAGVIEVEMLEEFFSWDLKCEGKHKMQPHCSHEVTSVWIYGCQRDLLVCKNQAEHSLRLLSTPRRYVCGVCGSPIDDCWRIIPI